jgi:hypothetical protein
MNTKSSVALRATALALLLALSGAGLYACQEKKKGPLERAGEKVDEKVNDAERAVEDAAD